MKYTIEDINNNILTMKKEAWNNIEYLYYNITTTRVYRNNLIVYSI